MCIVFFKHPLDKEWTYYKAFYSLDFALEVIESLTNEGREIKLLFTKEEK